MDGFELELAKLLGEDEDLYDAEDYEDRTYLPYTYYDIYLDYLFVVPSGISNVLW